MRLSFNTWLYCAFPTWLPLRSLDEVIDLLGNLGYDGIEIGAAAPHGFPDFLDSVRRQKLREHLHANRLEVSALCPALGGAPGYNPVSPEEAERAAGRRYIDDCIDLASDLGCENVIWLGGYRRFGQDPAEAWALAVDALRHAGAHAEAQGVRLLVEPTAADSNLLEDSSDCLRLIAEAGLTCDVMLDTFHILHRKDDLREAVRAAGGRLGYVHLADVNRDPPGTHTDFGPVIAELESIGYDGWLSMEIGFNRRESSADALASRALASVRELLSP